jgi:putative addiction module component (TIGR02574 family)
MTTVEQLRELSVEARLQIVGELWDSIAEDCSSLKLTLAQVAELDRRLDEVEKNPNEGQTWEEVRADIEKLL